MVVEHGIVVRNARKQYRTGAPVLKNLNLTVPRGCIYGLLGASGCGKTTLLSCVVGVRKLDSGDIWVLGGRPGTEESGVPGPRLGYMPQDISLVPEFSTIGSLYFFGRINGMDDHSIENRYLSLKELLQLPPRDRLVQNMSGGQQRRVSFAAALLHKPELLILDEPTVGLDPVLRDNIWNHLVKITREDGVTIIITTHYIEEAKQADRIGLMRCGQLLAESSPNELLEQCQTDSLEEAFLNLSQIQAQNQTQGVGQSPISSRTDDMLVIDSIQRTYVAKDNKSLRSNTVKRCKALLMKNTLQFVRHPGGVLFSILLPIIQIVLFYNSIGLDPKGIAISVVNDEAGNCNHGGNRGNVTYDEAEFTCDFVDISCRFMAGINQTKLKLLHYDSYDEATRDVSKRKSLGIMHFSRNFSFAMQTVFENFMAATEEDTLASQIDVTLLAADKQLGVYLQKVLYENFFDVYEEIMKECRVSAKVGHIPIHFEDPIFGTKDQTYISFIAPPYILLVLFILATSICSSIIITDRDSGVWDRSLVQGVTLAEILMTHLIPQMTVIVIQVTIALCLCFLHFDVECKGSMTAVIGIAVLVGICGMSYGFLISIICTSHTLVNYASVGSFYPLVLLCGMIWPIEGMPKFLRWFSLTLPLTIPGISLRGLLEKGTAVYDPEVYGGFLVLMAWILCFMSLCLFQMRWKST